MIEIKPCRLSDKHLLRNLSEQTYRDTFESQNKKSDIDAHINRHYSLASIEQQLENRHAAFFFAEYNGQTAAYMKLNHAPAQTDLNDSASLEVERLYVLPSFKGKGIGCRLLAYAAQQAQQDGLSYVWLGVWERNLSAIRFYEKNGFTRFSHHTYLLGEDKQLDYLMRNDLS